MFAPPGRRLRRAGARALLAALALLLMFLLIAPAAVHADFLDGWDTYPTSPINSNPGPWTWTPDSNCWTAAPQPWTSAQYPSAPAVSVPNVWDTAYSGSVSGCSGSQHTATLNLAAVATSQAVTIRFRVAQGPGVGSDDGLEGLKIPGIYICGALVPNSGQTTGGITGGTWKKLTYTAAATVGASCTITLTFITPVADSGVMWSMVLDNFYLKGAAAVLPVFDFEMWNLNLGTPYNVTAYDTPQNSTVPSGGLTLTTQYAGAGIASSILVAPLEPTVNLPLASASQVVVCVTNLYCNSFIPSASGTTNAYLVAPAQALSCLFQITNSANQFPPGSTITLTQGDALVASGYLDVNHEFTAFLATGTYNLEVVAGTLSFQTTVSVSASASSFTIPISGLLGSAFTGGLGTLAYNAGWDAPLQNVVYYFTDASTTTTYLRADLLKDNASGNFVMQTATFQPGPYGTVQGSFPCATNACNATLSAELSVLFTVTSQFGAKTPYGPVPLTVGGILPGIPGVPPNGVLGGMSEFFPGLNYLQLGAFFALVVGASAFGEYDAPLGAIVLAGLALVFVGLGALAWPVVVTASAVVVAVLAFIEWREKRSMNPYL